MRPFHLHQHQHQHQHRNQNQSNRNQIQTNGTTHSAPQQVMQPNPCAPNSNTIGTNPPHHFPNPSCAPPPNNSTIPSQSYTPNPQCPIPNPQCPIPSNGSNTHFNNFNGNDPQFPDVASQYIQLQNTLLAAAQIIQGQFLQQNPMAASQLHGHLANIPQNFNQMVPNGQWFANNQPQVMNQRPMQLNMPGPQFGFHNPPQHMNQMSGFPPGQFVQNLSNLPQGGPFNMPMGSLPMMGCSNQGPQNVGSQYPGFSMNPQFGMGNATEVAKNTQDQHMFSPPNMGQTQQNLHGTSHPSVTTGPAQMQQPSNCQKSQDYHAEYTGDTISNVNKRNPEGMNSAKNPDCGKRESGNSRFQKSNFHPSANVKRNFSPSRGKTGKGQHGKGARRPHPTNFVEQTKPKCQRPLSLSYSEQEIQEWRDLRRKNHPSNRKFEKKAGTHSEVLDDDARKRRQQLKEILAKQAELGVEVAELPPNYLSVVENQGGKREENEIVAKQAMLGTEVAELPPNNVSDLENQVGRRGEGRMWTKKGRFQNRNRKRQKHGKFDRFDKKQKLGESGSSPISAPNKKLTLLQKLLSTDIKRDKSHLLQAFRFMVLNSFFKDWPEKPLEFPSITVKDMGCGSVARKISPYQGDEVATSVSMDAEVIEEFEDLDDQHVEPDGDEDGAEGTECIGEEVEKSEEGEITD